MHQIRSFAHNCRKRSGQYEWYTATTQQLSPLSRVSSCRFSVIAIPACLTDLLHKESISRQDACSKSCIVNIGQFSCLLDAIPNHLANQSVLQRMYTRRSLYDIDLAKLPLLDDQSSSLYAFKSTYSWSAASLFPMHFASFFIESKRF
uniref:Apple domain-containing protein n=1 Tax=Ascaris lumbricoides TaxID=6252 RepID=A0A9J2Q4W9_ASCLU